MVKDITSNAKEKLGIEDFVITTVHLDERRDYWSVYPSLDRDGWIVGSGDLEMALKSVCGVKCLILALEYAVEMMELNED